MAAASLIVLVFYNPLWGYTANLPQQRPPFCFPNDWNSPIPCDPFPQLNDGYLAKRGSGNQPFQLWQDLSPNEQEKLRQRYREWQSLPPQKRKHYKQLFRQWQHLSPKERQQLQKDLNNWENLSPRQRDSIRRRFRN